MCKHKLQPHFEILVVDDDKISCLLHKSLLKSSNTEEPPVIFRNAERALDSLNLRNSPENCFLIFLELNLPLLNGWEFLNILKNGKFDCGIHIVLVTSSFHRKNELTSLKFENVIGFCRKPLKEEHVLKIKNLEEISHFFSPGNYFPRAVKCSTVETKIPG